MSAFANSDGDLAAEDACVAKILDDDGLVSDPLNDLAASTDVGDDIPELEDTWTTELDDSPLLSADLGALPWMPSVQLSRKARERKRSELALTREKLGLEHGDEIRSARSARRLESKSSNGSDVLAGLGPLKSSSPRGYRQSSEPLSSFGDMTPKSVSTFGEGGTPKIQKSGDLLFSLTEFEPVLT